MPYFAAISMTVHEFVFAAAKAKSRGSGASTLLFLVAIVGIGYFLLIRPQRQRAKRAQQQTQNIGVGDEVMLSSGIFGRVTGIDGDRANVEIAPEIEIEVVMRAIAQRITPADDVSEPDLVSPDPATDEEDDFAHASDDPDEEQDGEVDANDTIGVQDRQQGGDETAWPPTAVRPAASDIGGPVPEGGSSEDGLAGGGTAGGASAAKGEVRSTRRRNRESN